MSKTLPDVQSSESSIEKRIKKIGLRNVTIPIKITGFKGKRLNTIASVSIYSSLTRHIRGAHLSRYMEILYKAVRREISLDIVKTVLNEIKTRLESNDAYVKFEFDYFVKKRAPVSKKYGYVPHRVEFEGELKGDKIKLFLIVHVNYLSLCPCSKELAKFNAHCQRSVASVKVELKQSVRIEEIIDIVEGCSSSDLFSVLKRSDEKYVTEYAYEHPMFCEDMCREIATQLDGWLDNTINDYYVVVNHFEALHPYDAVAVITADRELQ